MKTSELFTREECNKVGHIQIRDVICYGPALTKCSFATIKLLFKTFHLLFAATSQAGPGKWLQTKDGKF